jgi:hypothetical protein
MSEPSQTEVSPPPACRKPLTGWQLNRPQVASLIKQSGAGSTTETPTERCNAKSHHGLRKDQVLEADPIVEAPKAVSQLRIVFSDAGIFGHHFPLAEFCGTVQVLFGPLGLLAFTGCKPVLCSSHMARPVSAAAET